ncbi:cupin domain-containing protein [Candidatus Bipolaricaulota bacterium]|nr:cupin domain-containing protein [Candidatus Bipolaricaulota bacterium]
MHFFRIPELPSTDMLPGIERRAVWLDQVMITFFVFQPRAVVPEHAHEHEQITVVTRGALKFTLGEETRILRAGDGVCIPPNIRHRALVMDELTEAYDAWSPPREDYKG